MANLRTTTPNESVTKFEPDVTEQSATVSKLAAELEKLKEELNAQWRRGQPKRYPDT